MKKKNLKMGKRFKRKSATVATGKDKPGCASVNGSARRTAKDCRDFLAELEHELPTCVMPFSGQIAGMLSRRLTEHFQLEAAEHEAHRRRRSGASELTNSRRPPAFCAAYGWATVELENKYMTGKAIEVKMCGATISLGDVMEVEYRTGREMKGGIIKGEVIELWSPELNEGHLQGRLSCGWCFHDSDRIISHVKRESPNVRISDADTKP